MAKQGQNAAARPRANAAKPVTRRRRRSRGALTAIGALLLGSALMRAAIGATEALAREAPAPERHVETPAEAAGHATPPPGESTPRIVAEADIMPLIEALDARESRIRKRESDIEIRMQALSVAEAEIERKMVALEEAEQSLRSTLALAKTAAEDDLSRLTDVYASMKPKQAAALFEKMDPEFAAGFLGRMRPDAAASIMAGMTPEAAYLVSVIVAGRNADVPKE